GGTGAAVLLRPVRRGDRRRARVQHRHGEEPGSAWARHAARPARTDHDHGGGPTVGLNDVLRAAAADPPPSRIDLDALIAGERDRLRCQRWLTGAGAVTAGVAVFGVAAFGGLGVLGAPFASLGSKSEPPPCPMLSPGAVLSLPPDTSTPYPLPVDSSIQVSPTPYSGAGGSPGASRMATPGLGSIPPGSNDPTRTGAP